MNHYFLSHCDCGGLVVSVRVIVIVVTEDIRNKVHSWNVS